MTTVKQAILRLLRSLGYELRHVRDHTSGFSNVVDFEVFNDLVKAYEQRLVDGGATVFENTLRSRILGRMRGTLPGEAFFIIEALAQTRNMPGDVCEFGVARGETSSLIATEIASTKKTLHLFDSFQGLPKPTDRDRLKDDVYGLGSMAAYEGKMSCPQEMVLARLKAVDFPRDRFVIHAGFIENLLANELTLPSQVSFAYVDFDFYEPITIALDFLNTVTAPGSIVIVDDYDYFSTGAKDAVDEFIAKHRTDSECFNLTVPNKMYGHFAVLTKIARSK